MDVIELLPQLFFLRFPVGNVYLWADPDGLTLIDTGVPGSGAPIAEAIRRIGRHPAELSTVLLTHFHEDHVGSVAEIVSWGDVEVLAHRADAPFIRGEERGPSAILADWERPIWDQVHAGMASEPVVPVHIDRELEDGDIIELGSSLSAVAVAAPGHTPGSVAFHLPEPRVLFTGDTAARMPDGEQVILGVFNADPVGAGASLQRLAALDTSIACFGHGDPVLQDASALLQAAAT